MDGTFSGTQFAGAIYPSQHWNNENQYARNLVDIDGDGMHNSWETLYGLDPNTDDAGDDADIDGYNNLEEYQGGTDPENPLSVPAAP